MKKRTVSTTSQASNQGSLRVTRAEYCRYYGSNPLSQALLYASSFLPLGVGLGRMFGGFRWRRFAEHFHFGDTNAVVVLDARKGIVAAYTDLDARLQKRFPVINVFKEKLRLLPQAAQTGDTFAAVSLYGRDEYFRLEGRWSTFHPILVDCVVRDQTACEFAKAKISDGEWKALEIGVSQLPAHPRLGIHHITLPDEIKAAL